MGGEQEARGKRQEAGGGCGWLLRGCGAHFVHDVALQGGEEVEELALEEEEEAQGAGGGGGGGELAQNLHALNLTQKISTEKYGEGDE